MITLESWSTINDNVGRSLRLRPSNGPILAEATVWWKRDYNVYHLSVSVLDWTFTVSLERW